MSLQLDQYTNTLSVNDTVTANSSLTLTPAGTGSVTTASPLSASSYVATGAITGSLNAGAYSYGTLPYSDVNIFASYTANQNNYAQIILHNSNAGTTASTDFIVGNNNTTATTFYGDFGMNSSAFSGTGTLNTANIVFLTSTSADLAIGTTTANNIRFVINNGATDIGTITSTGLNSFPIGATTASTGAFTSLTATSVGTAGVLAKTGGKTSVTAVTGSLTLATGGVTLASQAMASGSCWRVRAYGTYAASSSATARTLTMSCYWGSTALTAVTTGNVLASTAQTTPWQVELEITGSSATAAWCTAVLMSQVTSATIPQQYIATAASVTGLTTTSTLDFRVGQTGTAVAGDTINVHSVTIERII
jgi:hypothetical protein